MITGSLLQLRSSPLHSRKALRAAEGILLLESPFSLVRSSPGSHIHQLQLLVGQNLLTQPSLSRKKFGKYFSSGPMIDQWSVIKAEGRLGAGQRTHSACRNDVTVGMKTVARQDPIQGLNTLAGCGEVACAGSQQATSSALLAAQPL